MIRTIYTKQAYQDFVAFTSMDDVSGPDSPHGWGATRETARADLAEQLELEPCTDCQFGPCSMNCSEAV